MNYNLSQAIDIYNQNQPRVQTMYELDIYTGFDYLDSILKTTQVLCKGFILPDRTQNFEDINYRAYKIPIPTNLEMGQDHNMTFVADVRGDIRRAMLDWQAATTNPNITGGSYFQANRRPTRLGPGDGAQPSIVVKLLAPDMQTPVEQCLIYGTKVQKVGGLELSNDNASIATFQVDFKSVYWEQTNGTGQPSAMMAGATGSPSIGMNNADALRYGDLGQHNQENPGLATNDNTGRATNIR